MIAPIEIEEAVTEHRLLQTAMFDCIEAMAKFATVGHPIDCAVTRLDALRQMFDQSEIKIKMKKEWCMAEPPAMAHAPRVFFDGGRGSHKGDPRSL